MFVRLRVFCKIESKLLLHCESYFVCGMLAHWSHDQKYQSQDELAGALPLSVMIRSAKVYFSNNYCTENFSLD